MIIEGDNGASIEIKIGADPEVFAVSNNEVVSAYNMIPGTKDNPHVVDCGAIQVDGMALEFNITPANSLNEFVNNINTVMRELSNNVPRGIELAIVPIAEFGAEYINKQPEEARELGCSPDFSAYNNGEANDTPNAEMPFRSASGHLHLGWTEGMSSCNEEHKDVCIELTKVLDLYLGVPSVIMDSDTKRRELYGKAGSFRYKPYGLEYRVLSNFWLKSEEKIRWVYNAIENGAKAFLEGFRISDKEGEMIRKVINSSDSDKAAQLVSDYRLTVSM